MIGRLHHVVLDCPDPYALALFYSELVGLPVTYRSAGWVVIAKNDTTSGLAFQLAPAHQPPAWPDPQRPQQCHLDVMVDVVPAAAERVQELGARPLSTADGPCTVYADPAGHPFCLIPRPDWAPPIQIGAATGEVGSARMEMRVSPEQEALIRHAAELEGTTVTTLVLDTVTAQASSVIESHRDLVLSNEAFDRFLAELDRPAAPAPELVELFRSHPKLPEA